MKVIMQITVSPKVIALPLAMVVAERENGEPAEVLISVLCFHILIRKYEG